MGPSGAGKSRVIDFARRRLDGNLPVVFAHRYITRPLGKDLENYIFLSPHEFALRQDRGLFAFDWEAHDYRYGVGVEVKSWLASGLVVVVNGSRAHFIGHRQELGDVVPVLVTAGRDELRRRLYARERENAESIERRLDRAAEFMPTDQTLVTLDNSGQIERAGEAFVALLSARAQAS